MRFRDAAGLLLPERRGVLTAAAAAWCGALLGLAGAPALSGLVACAGGAWAIGRRRVPAMVLVFAGAGCLAGAAAAHRIEVAATLPVTPGSVEVVGRAITDPLAGDEGDSEFVLRVEVSTGRGTLSPGTVVLVAWDVPDGDGQAPFVAGDRVRLAGDLRDAPGRRRGDAYRAAIGSAEVTAVEPATGLWAAGGNALRGFVLGRLEPVLDRPAAALLAGFLVGDTSYLSTGDLDDLRAAGLTHFVAVSGSNVALFLAAWWVVTTPFRLDPRWRAATSLVVLGVFVVATRWEPSVVRAAAMACVVLGGRIVGTRVDPWDALCVAVTGLLLVSADLAMDVGFQLSALATAGVIAAMRVPVTQRPKALWRIALATLGAQLAVLPVLLATFGTVPLLSPVSNVLAAPLVTAATVLGGVGALVGVPAVRDLGLVAADGVLVVARLASSWPQLGVPAALAVVTAAVAVAGRRTRTIAVAGIAVWIAVAVYPVAAPTGQRIVFMDVGQGDAIAIVDRTGNSVVVDGGRDPDVLAAALERNGIARIELLVVTHGDADHTGGLVGLAAQVPIGQMWYPAGQRPGPILEDLVEEAERHGVPVTTVRTGATASMDGVHIQVVSPGRRYAGDNDGSIVLWVASAGGTTVLLTGDIEAVAQAELPELRPDVLQVPHHGSSTTDLGWLAQTAASHAVVSVGENTFGHPAPAVVGLLTDLGSSVHVTLDDGDVTFPLG